MYSSDKKGYHKFQIHELARIFGKHLYLGCCDLPFKTDIIIQCFVSKELIVNET